MHCRDHDDVVNDGVLGRVSREEKCIDFIDEVLELGGRYLQRRRKSAARGGPIKGPEGTHPTLELKRKRRVKPACTINQNVSRPSHSSRVQDAVTQAGEETHCATSPATQSRSTRTISLGGSRPILLS